MGHGVRQHGVLAVLVGILLTGCGSAGAGAGGSNPSGSTTSQNGGGLLGGGDKVGGRGNPIVLTIGTNDGPPGNDVNGNHFAAEVDRRSGGLLKIEPRQIRGDGVPKYNQKLAEMVLRGELDLAEVPSRAFDELGVTSLQAIQAPFLLTDDDAVDAVVTGPLAADLMSGLPAAGYEGLALWPEALRHAFGEEGPIRTLADFHGLQVRTPASHSSFELLEALGARPIDFGVGVPAGVGAAETSFRATENLGVPGVMTANVVFFPKVYTVIVGREAFQELTAEQRAILRDAATATTTWLVENRETEEDAARWFCATGQPMVRAHDADLAAIVAAGAPVYADLEKDDMTARLIGEMRSIVSKLAEPVFAAKPCNLDALARPDTTPTPGLTDDPSVLNGVYRADVSADYLRARGLSQVDAFNNGGIWTLTFKDGRFSHHLSRDGTVCEGPYTVIGSMVSVSCATFDPLFTATWTLRDGALRFTKVTPGDALAQAGWGGQPFTRIADAP